MRYNRPPDALIILIILIVVGLFFLVTTGCMTSPDKFMSEVMADTAEIDQMDLTITPGSASLKLQGVKTTRNDASKNVPSEFFTPEDYLQWKAYYENQRNKESARVEDDLGSDPDPRSGHAERPWPEPGPRILGRGP